jgi:23S rRNA (uracil1939-C5)-methyltransferase
MREIIVTIERMAFGGAGVGYDDGKVCFIPFSAPGDLARVRVTSEKRSYIEGEIIELLKPSSLRSKPACPVFSICGGCNWQHLSYSVQLVEKHMIFSNLMWRSGRIEPERILPVIPAPDPYGYRARVQLKVHFAAGELHTGFYRTGSHFVVNLPGSCAIAAPKINLILPELQRILQAFPEPDKVPQIDVTIDGNNTAAVIFHYIGCNLVDAADFINKNRSMLASSEGIYIQSGRKRTMQKIAGPESLEYQIFQDTDLNDLATRLTFTPGGFSQVNYRQNQALVVTVLDWCGLTGNERLLDIFCGNGNFSVPLASKCTDVVGIEEYEPSILSAYYNCQINELRNLQFLCTDAVNGVSEFVNRKEVFDVVLLDPPRTGAAEIVRLIPSLKPGKIVYISCDPPTLARDIGILKGYNYDVIKSQPIDMFPQTYHIESITLLAPSHKEETVLISGEKCF